MATIVKLLTNVACDVDVRAVYYAATKNPGQYQDQVKVRGTWTGKAQGGDLSGTEGDCYLPLSLLPDLLAAGLVQDLGSPDRDGNPAYRVGHPQWTIQREQGPGGKTFTRVVARGTPVAAPTPAPSGPPRPVPTTVKRTASGPGMPKDAAPHKGSASPVTDGDALWDELEARYQRCVGVAERAYAGQLGPTAFPDAFVAAVATLFIEANRRNLPGQPPVVAAPNGAREFADFPAALATGEDPF